MFDVYQSANQGNWRISIGRAGRRTLVVLGLHPGLTHADDDVELAEKVARANGCDGFVSMNLCPIRAADLHGLPSAIEDLAYTLNVDEVARFAFRSSPAPGRSLPDAKVQAHANTSSGLLPKFKPACHSTTFNGSRLRVR